MTNSNAPAHIPNGVPHPIPIDRGRRPVPIEAGHFRRMARQDLLDIVDLFLEAVDVAASRGDLVAERRARALWGSCWDRIDALSGATTEAAQ